MELRDGLRGLEKPSGDRLADVAECPADHDLCRDLEVAGEPVDGIVACVSTRAGHCTAPRVGGAEDIVDRGRQQPLVVVLAPGLPRVAVAATFVGELDPEARTDQVCDRCEGDGRAPST
jgi:hypothetical protein